MARKPAQTQGKSSFIFIFFGVIILLSALVFGWYKMTSGSMSGDISYLKNKYFSSNSDDVIAAAKERYDNKLKNLKAEHEKNLSAKRKELKNLQEKVKK